MNKEVKTPRKKSSASSKDDSKGTSKSSSKSSKEKPVSAVNVNHDDLLLDVELSKVKRPFNAELFGHKACLGFTKLWTTKDLSDITLVLHGEKVKAHRTVLSIWSDHFRAMLEHDRWKESNLAELPVEVEEHEVECFKHMLRYMYTGQTDFVNGDNIVTLISLSNYYGVHHLKETCAAALGQLISDDSLLYFLKICDQYDCKKLEEACGEHLAEHFEEMIGADKLNSLEPSIWAEMLKSDELQITSEEKLFECVVKYCNQFKGEKDRWLGALEMLLPHIRFPLLSGAYLVDHVETEETLSGLPLMHQLLHEAYRFKSFPAPSDNPRMKPRKGFRFDTQQNTAGIITISQDGLTCSLINQSGWYSARTVQPLNGGCDYVEFKVEGGTNIMIGVAQAGCQLTGYAGQYSNGWQYYTNGQVYHNSGCPSNGTTYAVGDTLGVWVDFTAGRITWYKNGTQCAQLAGLPTSSDLYPIVSLSAAGNSVSVKPRALRPTSAT
eukprot:TRINITY_DN5652_c0_g1_i1.p1 TRINITY_DN5652_c0_g1~~TRINITY_DN5652_c0_g1_i1.p1  ORF type:complete len:495 (-),score=68.03 TRINITY_DN5652_c0_g1_i1:12-1496(-)